MLQLAIAFLECNRGKFVGTLHIVFVRKRGSFLTFSSMWEILVLSIVCYWYWLLIIFVTVRMVKSTITNYTGWASITIQLLWSSIEGTVISFRFFILKIRFSFLIINSDIIGIWIIPICIHTWDHFI